MSRVGGKIAMSEEQPKGETVERGSALVISILVTAIMSLLGISYLLMADTENKIAENERLSGQCLYVGEGVVREVKRWFDRPPYLVNGTKNLVQPTTAIVDRTKRMIDTDGDGPTSAHQADGSATYPYYKVGVDSDGDGNDDIFDKPYRALKADMLLGTELNLSTGLGPDMLIDRTSSAARATFLDSLTAKIAPNFPTSNGTTVRIKRIEIYEPPYLTVSGVWTRYGMATVKVVVEIVKGATPDVIASRVVKAVLNETPYPGPFGPLQSCDTLAWNGSFRVHWGPATARTTADPKANTLPTSIPRDVPTAEKLDLLHGTNPLNDPVWTTLKASIEGGKSMDDPWWRLLSNGANTLGGGSPQLNPPSPTDPDHSNIFQNLGSVVGCPAFDYNTWKDIAKSGDSDTHYFTWSTGDTFVENGSGTATTFRTLTDNQNGLFFFDTQDQAEPNSANLTPPISISGGTYGSEGFIYLNASDFEGHGMNGRSIDMVWPGEPWRDVNQDGLYDSTEGYINLNYSTISTTDPTVQATGSAGDSYGGAIMRNNYGPHITGQTAVMWGVLYLSGTFDCNGNAWYYGSVVTKGGMKDTMTGTPDLWWDPRLTDNWPPPSWNLPRVIITRWETDL